MDPIQKINEDTNLAKLHQNALGFAMPPFVPFRTFVSVQEGVEVESSAELKSRLESGLVENTNWIVPLTFQKLTFVENGKETTLDSFKFPLDPIISLSSKNIITRRYVNKSKTRGSIKERWSQDDWEITISGVIIAAKEVYPKATLKALRDFCDAPKSVDVLCDLLNEMDIYHLSIESVDFPFTKGIGNQAFVIKAYSDGDYDLLIKN